jgi:superfamily II DNA or RNA helicase
MTKKPAGEKPTARQADRSPKSRIKAEEYAARAGRALLSFKHREALDFALRALKLDPKDIFMQRLALECAQILQDDAAMLLLLKAMYRDGILADREGYLLLGRVALANLDYALAAEVYGFLLEDAAGGKSGLKGRFTKARLKEAQQGLRLAQLMLEKASPPGTPAPPPSRPRVKTVDLALQPLKLNPGKASQPVPATSSQKPIPVLPRKQKPAAHDSGVSSREPSAPLSPQPQATGRRPPARDKAPPLPPAAKSQGRANAVPSPGKKAVPGKKATTLRRQATPAAAPAPLPAALPEPLPDLKIVFATEPAPLLTAVQSRRQADPEAVVLALDAYRLSFRTSFDQLLCLPTLKDVRSLWHQEDTARKVMKDFRGRAILADEVGLGKTIEAGLILKEYLLRGLVKTALVLAPSSLVSQWQEELAGKFGIPFVSTQEELFRMNPAAFWAEPFILASLQTVRSKRHFAAVTSRSYDLVVVDEAHHLKNRATQNWKLVNALQKTFLLMLTATPVQNSLEELYNLVTLLRPGHLKTQKAFKAEFIARGNPTDPLNREKLRQLLKEVMVRNTRAATQLKLPPRFARTVRLAPTPAEGEFYQAVSRMVTVQAVRPDIRGGDKLAWRQLLQAAGSSPAAALRMLERLHERQRDGLGSGIGELMALGRAVRRSAKVEKVVEFLRASPEQKILFVNYLASLEYLAQALTEYRIPHAIYQGGLTPAQKQAALTTFREGCPVLLATGTGGEGHNLQFCHVMLNFDLPWNPMEIEQRIGRLHRIGQEKEVQVYNFCTAGSIEDHILEVLDKKINLFELVVGEIDMVLGRLEGEEEFSDLVYDIWIKHPEEDQRRQAFEVLAQRLRQARTAYEKSKELDEKLFQEDFGV